MKPSYNNYDILNSSDQMNVYLEMQSKGWLNHANTSRGVNGGVFGKMFNQMYIYNEASDSYALKNDAPSQKSFLQRYANANTDWFDVLFKQSFMQERAVSVSSGTERSKIYASTSFLQDNGWSVGDNVKRNLTAMVTSMIEEEYHSLILILSNKMWRVGLFITEWVTAMKGI